MTPHVRFLPFEMEAAVEAGAYLTLAAIRARVPIVHDCDGQGVCGTCRVKVEKGADHLETIDPLELRQLGRDIEEGWRLCCRARVLGDVTVRIPAGGFAYPPRLQR